MSVRRKCVPSGPLRNAGNERRLPPDHDLKTGGRLRGAFDFHIGGHVQKLDREKWVKIITLIAIGLEAGILAVRAEIASGGPHIQRP
jgi:hypothetical protein